MPESNTRETTADFESELREFARLNELGKQTPTLLDIALLLKRGEATEGIRTGRKAQSLAFIHDRLSEADPEIRDAFFQYLLASELADDSPQLRNDLWSLLQATLSEELDALTVGIASTLLRSTKPPAAPVLSRVFPIARKQFMNRPDWSVVGLLAKGVGRVTPEYAVQDLINDISLLNKGDYEQFARAVRIRNPIWTSLPTPLDAIDILNFVGSSHPSTRHKFPQVEFRRFAERAIPVDMGAVGGN